MTMTLFSRTPALFSALFLGLAGPALAGPALAGASLTVPLETGAEANILTGLYTCAGGEPFTVQYINAGENNLALLPVDGSERVFVLTVSASGARYVAGAQEWWTKDDSATLDDTTNNAPPVECVISE